MVGFPLSEPQPPGNSNLLRFRGNRGDKIVKYLLPYSERSKVLKDLDPLYQINEYTLFGAEDALMKTLDLKAFGGWLLLSHH